MNATPEFPALLVTKAILRLTGISRSTLHRWIKDGLFPAPLKLGAGPSSRSAWLKADIDAWLTARIANRGEVAA